MIKSTTLNHQQVYQYRYHQAKLDILFNKKSFIHPRFQDLKTYLTLIEKHFPHEYFLSGSRSSKAGPSYVLVFYYEICRIWSFFSFRLHFSGSKTNIHCTGPQLYGNIDICQVQLSWKSNALAAFDKALELDPKYEPGMVNKAMTEALVEGEKSVKLFSLEK